MTYYMNNFTFIALALFQELETKLSIVKVVPMALIWEITRVYSYILGTVLKNKYIDQCIIPPRK